MISKQKKQALHKIFEQLDPLERKLMALKIICSEYNSGWYRSEEKFVDELIKSGMHLEDGKTLTHSGYKTSMKRLESLNLVEKNVKFMINGHLEHDFLIWMSTVVPMELTGVFSVVDHLYPRDTNNDELLINADENTEKMRVHLLKALYTNETNYFLAHSDNPIYCKRVINYLEHIFGVYQWEAEVDLDWLSSRDPVIQAFFYIYLLPYYFCEMPMVENNAEILALFCAQDFTHLKHDFIHYFCAMIFISLGKIDKAIIHADKIRDSKSGFYLALQATFAFLSQKFEQAGGFYTKALTALRKQYHCRYYYFDNVLGFFHGLYVAFVEKNARQLSVNVAFYQKYVLNKMHFLPMGTTYELLLIIQYIERGEHAKGKEEWLDDIIDENINSLDDIEQHPFPQLVDLLLRYMVNPQTYLNENTDSIIAQFKNCMNEQQQLMAYFLSELLSHSDAQDKEAIAFYKASPVKLKLLEFISPKEAWEYSFQALEELLLNDSTQVPIGNQVKRLLWLVNPDKKVVDVAEQSLNKAGKWSAGKAISINKLRDYHLLEQFSYLTPEDKVVANCIVDDGPTWYHQSKLDTRRALLALVGHPNVVHYQNRDTKITLVFGEPELFIEEVKTGYRIHLSHYLAQEGIILEPESMNQYRVIDFSKAFVQVGKILTKKGLVIPAMAKEKVLNVIQHAKHDIKIHVELQDSNLPEITGDATPHIQLLPVKQGIKATLWTKPVLHHGTYCKAGQGNKSLTLLLAQDDSEREVRTRILRDLALEKNNVESLLKSCPTLKQHESDVGVYEMETPEETLEVLSELQEYSEHHSLITEWPQGQTFKIKQRLFAQNLSLKITSDNNWFLYQGEMKLMDGEVINMKSLLEALDTSAVGRFVRLGNGEFLELTQQLKKQLRLLQTISDGNRINALGAQVLSDIASEAENIVFDAGWEGHLKKIKTMQKHVPQVPSTLQAILRDYQLEGFQYLSRLTHWGIGACLADDMGLGKTVQAIALLLERSKQGPALVIAPTSVGFNWVEELKKFAPTLNVHSLRTAERTALIEKATKFDVVICSYGLLQHNEELLSNKNWETIILDEAQAIKNAFTKRWKSVMKLKGNNRVALSGTPIENHLGELWSIFSFINPGLLGTIQSFQNKYATPIENGQSADKVQALKTLVSPYILRRIKSDVLTELPPKTEQTIHVAQSKEEAVFYEALRQKAEERIRRLMSTNDRLGVLAEITKLRQACCDSSLVDSAISIENSKLNLFIETIKNIIDNGHKALVFSQYVSFLSIVKKRIEAENISYQYLDGSTSPAKRKKAVEAFQAGEGDLFLLSLKAGGSGLNLTAADYVVHLDPWWNPAVEDQASDRAHRIGQERPVTIYRFIMQNTIEEKIISLHEHKRNLANELLSGQGVSGKLSNEDLMKLIYRDVE
jgi:SNF2 family DNA or RNA helicase